MCVCNFSYSACNAHALYYSHLWPDRICLIFPHYLINDKIFEEKKNTKYTNTCVLSLKVLSKIFFILRTQLDTIMNVRRSSCKVQWARQADTTKQTVALRNFATFFIQCSLISGKKKHCFLEGPQVSPGCPSRKTNVQQGMWQWCDDDDRENPCPNSALVTTNLTWDRTTAFAVRSRGRAA